MRTPVSRFLILRTTLFVVTLASFAQFFQRGSISAAVTEAMGAVVRKASLTLPDLGRNQTSTATTMREAIMSFPSSRRKLPGLRRTGVIQEVDVRSAIATLESGNALTVYNGAGNQANDFARYNGLGNLDMSHNRNFAHCNRIFAEYFDPSAFVMPPPTCKDLARPASCVDRGKTIGISRLGR
jgi:hypothetical protein